MSGFFVCRVALASHAQFVGKDTWNNNLHRILLSPLSYVSFLECTPARKVNSHSHQALSFEYI